MISASACSDHSDCPSGSFCHQNHCDTCDECKFCSDGVGGTCGTCNPTMEQGPCEGYYWPSFWKLYKVIKMNPKTCTLPNHWFIKSSYFAAPTPSKGYPSTAPPGYPSTAPPTTPEGNLKLFLMWYFNLNISNDKDSFK